MAYKDKDGNQLYTEFTKTYYGEENSKLLFYKVLIPCKPVIACEIFKLKFYEEAIDVKSYGLTDATFSYKLKGVTTPDCSYTHNSNYIFYAPFEQKEVAFIMTINEAFGYLEDLLMNELMSKVGAI